ncbi:hypothetical protein NBH00_21160 [Paraconexibacter antarcticus]|uniref:Uncharacterized protein n=1 Tax=Paraconexibacter antarcticus TaxID=2949664 RepID=A0ABY5DSC0_9ACTN|nr:hypothetical protein [Paraconexibacter antarcticus]UTI63841.1 hypothetical protein NBH00_21160 [Paraconexibacter antarcticus]
MSQPWRPVFDAEAGVIAIGEVHVSPPSRERETTIGCPPDELERKSVQQT